MSISGFNDNFTQEVVFGTHQYGGGGDILILSKYCTGVWKDTIVLTYVQTESRLQVQIQVLVEPVDQVEVSREQVINTNIDWIQYVTSTWLSSLWIYLNQIDSGIIT